MLLNSHLPDSSDNYAAEVVDECNRILCVMPKKEILRQGLAHRAAGAILHDPNGKMLLRRGKDGAYGLPVFAVVPAGVAAEEFCASLVKKQFDYINVRPRRAVGLDAGERTGNAFITIFACLISSAFIHAQRDKESLLADKIELAALTTRKGLVAPLLELLLANLGGSGDEYGIIP